MIKPIIQKELKELWREGRVKWLTIIIALLLIATIITSYRYSRHLKDTHALAMHADRKVWESQPEKNPHSAAHFGFYLFKPVYPLSIFEPGVDRYTGSMLYLEAHKRNSEQFSAIADESDIARTGFLSPAFVLQFLIPLLIIVAGFNIISKEKENANLSLLISLGCTPRQLFWGKWFALYSLIIAILIPVFISGLIILTAVNAGGNDYVAALIMLLLYLLFYAIIINVVLYVSAKAKKSGYAFLYCILFWMISSVLVPKLAGSIAQQQSPLLTPQQVIDVFENLDKAHGASIHELSGPTYKHLVDSMLKKYNADSVNQLPVNMAGIRLDVGEQLNTHDYEVITMMQLDKLKKQQQIITAAGILSPFIPSNQISMAVANTDVYSHHDFTDSGEQYRRKYVNMMNRYIAYGSGLHEAFTSFKAGKDLWKTVPQFQYQQPGLPVLKHYYASIVVLIIWLMISSIIFTISVNRFKPAEVL